METEILQAIDKKLEGVNKLTSSLDAYLAKMNEEAKRVLEVPKPKTVDETVAEMAEKLGIFDKAMQFEVWNIKLGQAAIGGFAAIFASELVDGFMSTQTDQIRGLVKLGVAGATVAFAGRWLGRTFTTTVALLLTFDAIRDLTPINEWAANLADKITGITTSAGLAGTRRPQGSVQAQVNQVANSYYSSVAARSG